MKWLREFRLSTPREARARYLQSVTPNRIPKGLADMSPSKRATRYSTTLWCLSAWRLEHPTALTTDQAIELVQTLARLYVLKFSEVATDLRRMVGELRRGHQRWELAKARGAARTSSSPNENGGVSPPPSKETST